MLGGHPPDCNSANPTECARSTAAPRGGTRGTRGASSQKQILIRYAESDALSTKLQAPLIGKPRSTATCQRKPTRILSDAHERYSTLELRGKWVSIFAKAAALCINTNTGGSPVAMGRTHITHASHASRLLSLSLSHHLLPARSRTQVPRGPYHPVAAGSCTT